MTTKTVGVVLGAVALALVLGPISAAQGAAFGPSSDWPNKYEGDVLPDAAGLGFVSKVDSGVTASAISTVANGILTMDNTGGSTVNAGNYVRWSVGNDTPLASHTTALEFRYRINQIGGTPSVLVGWAHKALGDDPGEQATYLVHHQSEQRHRAQIGFSGNPQNPADRACGGNAGCKFTGEPLYNPTTDFRTVRMEREFNDGNDMPTFTYSIDGDQHPDTPDEYTAAGFGGTEKGMEFFFGLRNTLDTNPVRLEIDFFRWTDQVIPEPASLALLSLGGLVMLRRRR